MTAPTSSPTDALIEHIEALRPVLDHAPDRLGVQIRAVLDRGRLTQVRASIKQYDERAP